MPYGETVTYGELAALAGTRTRSAPSARSAPHNRFAIVVPCHRVVAADGLGSYGSLGVAYKRRLLELEVPLSEDLRNELAAIAPERDCDRLAELSGLAHSAGSVHLLGRGEVAVHFDVAGNAVARRVFGLLRAFGVDAEIRTYRRRAFDRSTRYQVHVEGDERAAGADGGGILGPGSGRPSGRRAGSSRARAAARRTCAARSSAAAR